DGARHRPMVVILDRVGSVVEVTDPWAQGVRAGTSYALLIAAAAPPTHDAARNALSLAVAEVLSGSAAQRQIDFESEGAFVRVAITARSIGQPDGASISHTLITDEMLRAAQMADVERRLKEIYEIADIGDFEYVAAQDCTRLSPPILRMFGLPDDAHGK